MRNDEDKQWLVIIPSMPSREFSDLWERWRAENKAMLEELEPDWFVVQEIRAAERTCRRRLLLDLGKLRSAPASV